MNGDTWFTSTSIIISGSSVSDITMRSVVGRMAHREELSIGLWIGLCIGSSVFLSGCDGASEKRASATRTIIGSVDLTIRSAPDSAAAEVVAVPVDLNRLKSTALPPAELIPIRYNEPLSMRIEAVVPATHTQDDLREPGKGDFATLQSLPLVGTDVPAGIPTSILAKDPQSKERNPKNFSLLSKLQGLNHGNISYLMQDRSGNIWMATYGGGATRYDGRSFTPFTTKEGLCHNTLYCAAEDVDGNIWFGSNGGGLSRFDGSVFTSFNTSNGFGTDVVRCLLVDREGRVWAGTQGSGIVCIEGDSAIPIDTTHGLLGNTVYCAMQDRNGRLWLGTDKGICTYNGKSFRREAESSMMAGRPCLRLLEDRNGNIWAGTDGAGLFRFNANGITQFMTDPAVTTNRAESVIEGADGHLWFGMNESGLMEFDGRSFRLYTEMEGLPVNSVRSLLEDRSGVLWVGTWTGGVAKLDARCFTSIGKQDGLTDKVICNVMAGPDTTVLLSTSWMTVSAATTYSLRNQAIADIVGNDAVMYQLPASDGSTWYGTLRNGAFRVKDGRSVQLTTAQGLPLNDIRCMAEDAGGHIWLGTSGSGIVRFDGHGLRTYNSGHGLVGTDARAMIPDGRNGLWIGTLNGGLNHWDGTMFRHFSHPDIPSLNSITSLARGADGLLWVGTNGGGVVCLKGNKAVVLDEDQGLSNNVVQSILEDFDGNIWLGTRFGISCLPSAQKKHVETAIDDGIAAVPQLRVYTYDDGLAGMGVNGGRTMAQAADGRIWMAANDRVMIYDPAADRTDTIRPNAQITGLMLFNEKVDWAALASHPDTSLQLSNGVPVSRVQMTGRSRWYGIPEGLSLSYRNSNITFSYIGISTFRPKKVRYRHRLDGLESDWGPVTDRTEATYGNLAPGTYTFRVKAMSSEGLWGNEQTYTFTIRPPWWLTWWAYVSYVVLAVVAFGGYVKWRERNLLDRQRDLEHTVYQRTAELHQEKDLVQEQKELVEQKNREILDSIAYAQRIQRTILPSARSVEDLLGDAFTLYLPKDIVAGDFYWLEQVESDQKVYLAVCDCTGHGVPGALVSLLCHNALNRAVHQHGMRSPATILDMTSQLVINDLNRNTGTSDEVKDGMDASVCAYQRATRTLHWAGANNSLFIVRDGALTEVKGDKQPVGHHIRRIPYTEHSFDLRPGDMVYMTTDGFADQFGGPDDRKFQRSRLREMFVSISVMPIQQQRASLIESFTSWRGANEQLDDVTVVGFRA